MRQPDSEKKANKAFELENYPGKIARRDIKNWVKVCPACFTPNIRPLTNISGIIVQEQWFCPQCSYAGVVIEVNAEDLIRFQLQQKARRYLRNQKK